MFVCELRFEKKNANFVVIPTFCFFDCNEYLTVPRFKAKSNDRTFAVLKLN